MSDSFPIPKTVLSKLPFPRKVLRVLLQETGVGIGSRVLICGGQQGSLHFFLESLGLDVLTLANSKEHQQEVLGHFPETDVSIWKPHDFPPVEPASFDLALVYECSLSQCNLADSETLDATAKLLASVRPGGKLGVIRYLDPDAKAPFEQHTSDCHKRWLKPFGMNISHCEISEGLTRFYAWQRSLTGKAECGYEFFQLTMGSDSLSYSDWKKLIPRSTGSLSFCCDWIAEQLASEVEEPRHAA